jgi:hypothetical protein
MHAAPGEVRVERKRDRPLAGRLRDREVPRPVAEIGEAWLQVQWQRVVRFGADSPAGQVFRQAIPLVNLDKVDIPDGINARGTWHDSGNTGDSWHAAQSLGIELREPVPPGNLAIEIG